MEEMRMRVNEGIKFHARDFFKKVTHDSQSRDFVHETEVSFSGESSRSFLLVAKRTYK